MDYRLRPYQKAAVEAVLNTLEFKKRIHLVLATGTGQNVVITELIKAFNTEKNILVLTDRVNEAQQLVSVLTELLDERRVSLLSASRQKSLESRGQGSYVDVVNIQSVSKFPVSFVSADVVFLLDIKSEAQLNSFIGLVSLNKDAKTQNLIAITSTPLEHMEAFFGDVIYQYNFSDAIKDQYMLPFTYFAGPRLKDLQLSGSVFIDYLLSNILEQFEFEQFRKGIVFCKNQQDANYLFEGLKGKDKNIRPVLIHSKVNQVKRLLHEFAVDYQFNLAIVVEMFSGIDIPSVTDLIFLRHFNNQTTFEQALSRALRPHKNKEKVLIWDFSNNKQYLSSGVEQVRSLPAMNFVEESRDNSDKTPEVETVIDEVNDELANEPIVEVTSEEANDEVLEVKRIIPIGDQVNEKDLLGRESLVHVLEGLILHSNQQADFRPFVIGLFGSWGTGKSNVIHLLKKQFVNKHHYNFIEFNAWQNEHCQNMAASLATEIIDTLYQEHSLHYRLNLRLRKKLYSKVDSTGVLLVLAALSLAFAVLWDKNLLPPPKILDHWLEGNSISAAFIISLLLTIGVSIKSYLDNPFTQQIIKLAKKPNYSEHLGVGQKIKDDIRDLFFSYSATFTSFLKTKVNLLIDIFAKRYNSLENYKKPIAVQQFVIVIDDLDRCSDQRIVEVLEAIRLVIDLPQVTVVLAVDKKILLNAVASRYLLDNPKLDKSLAYQMSRDFLAKIIQLTVELNDPELVHLDKFVKERLYANVDDFVNEDEIDETLTPTSIHSQQNQDDIYGGYDIAEVNKIEFYDEELTQENELLDDYLTSEASEVLFFSKCINAFSVTNPRTLIRLHNTIMFVKGLYPSLNHSNILLEQHIFIIFLFELYASGLVEQRQALQDLIDGQFADPTEASQHTIVELAKSIRVHELNKYDFLKYWKRVTKLSLPFGAD